MKRLLFITMLLAASCVAGEHSNFNVGDSAIWTSSGEKILIVDQWGQDQWGYFYRIKCGDHYRTVHEMALTPFEWKIIKWGQDDSTIIRPEPDPPCERQFWLDETKTDRVSSDSLEYVREVTTRRWYKVIGNTFEGATLNDTSLVLYYYGQSRSLMVGVEQIRGEVIKIDTVEIWRKSVRVWPGPSKKDTTAFIIPFPIDSVEIWQNDIDSNVTFFDDLIGETIRDTGLFYPNDTIVFDTPYIRWKDQFGRTWELVADSTPVIEYRCGCGKLQSECGHLSIVLPDTVGWEPKLVFRLVEEEKP